jgi:hypothetical protein
MAISAGSGPESAAAAAFLYFLIEPLACVSRVPTQGNETLNTDRDAHHNSAWATRILVTAGWADSHTGQGPCRVVTRVPGAARALIALRAALRHTETFYE